MALFFFYQYLQKGKVHNVFGDGHIDAFLNERGRRQPARGGELLFSGGDTEMMDAKAGAGDKKRTKKTWVRRRERGVGEALGVSL